MRAKSHFCLGQKLIDNYMSALPFPCRRAFLIGCTQPDKNPTTYIKGSVRSQWLRGHNWSNAKRYLRRLICRLEKKKQFQLMDYYALGKLMHYIADAFTYVHNDTISAKLTDHRKYEAALETYFLPYLESASILRQISSAPCQCILCTSHKKYLEHPGSIQADTKYIYRVCCSILYKLLPK